MKAIIRLSLVAALIALLPLAAAAQAQAQAQAQGGFAIMSLENGYAPGYNVGTGNWNVASRFSLNMHVTENLFGGFTFLDGDGTVIPDYRYLRLGYTVGNRLGLCVILGSAGANPLSGLGLDVIAFQRRYQDAFTTQFKAQLEYLFQPTAANGLTSGILLAGLAFSIGI